MRNMADIGSRVTYKPSTLCSLQRLIESSKTIIIFGTIGFCVSRFAVLFVTESIELIFCFQI